MKKRILITGATDGIGLETAKMILESGHDLIIHGRNLSKSDKIKTSLFELFPNAIIDTCTADLSDLKSVRTLAENILDEYDHLDVLINNAGVFKVDNPTTSANLDIRFVVNCLAPYMLTQKLSELLKGNGRIINVSSAAQSKVNLQALRGLESLTDMAAYSQSKLALTMWSKYLAEQQKLEGLVYLSVNPGSLLGSKMVKEGFGVNGGDLKIGAEILTKMALAEEFSKCSGQYFDNDSGHFLIPHNDIHNEAILTGLIDTLDELCQIN